MDGAAHISVSHPRRLGSLVIAVAAATAGLLLASAIVLWAYYGTALFYEMIVAGIAACI